MEHLSGVTELNAYEIFVTPMWLTITMLASVALTVVLVVTIANLNNPRGVLPLGIATIIMVLVVGALGMTCGFGWADEYDHTEYEVLIDDGIPYSDITNTYDVIEQRGDIFVVRFKEVNE